MDPLPLPPRPKERHLSLAWTSERTWLLGALLVVVFGFLFWLAPRLVGGGGIVEWALVVLLIGAMVWFLRSQGRRFKEATAKGAELMNAGMLRAAIEIFERSAHTPLAALQSAAIYNVALSSLLLGEHARALSLAGEIEQRLRQLQGVKLHTAGLLALGYALEGHLDSASAWVEEAKRREQKHGGDKVHVVAEAIVLCRRGKFAEAEGLLSKRWTELERTMVSDFVRGARLVCAFALVGKQPPDSAAAQTMVAGARPCRPGEFDFLGTAWPEMARFLASQGFVKAG